jgi:hypothetical protein
MLCGAAATLLVTFMSYRVQSELEAIEAQHRELSRKLTTSAQLEALDPAKLRALTRRIQASNRVLDALDQPWFRLFGIGRRHRGVALPAGPDAVLGGVRLVASARPRALARYPSASEGCLVAGRISQHELRDGTERALMRFRIAARWVRVTEANDRVHKHGATVLRRAGHRRGVVFAIAAERTRSAYDDLGRRV